MGTSLTVYPFASLKDRVPRNCPRLLLNLDHVGGWGSRANDVACLMSCDKAVRQLCKLLGWEEDLDRLWASTELPQVPKEKPSAAPSAPLDRERTESGDNEERVPSEQTDAQDVRAEVDKLVEKLAEEVEWLKVDGDDHSERAGRSLNGRDDGVEKSRDNTQGETQERLHQDDDVDTRKRGESESGKL